MKEEDRMHYRNGREAQPGNDYCNGVIAPVLQMPCGACLADCLHAEDLAALLAEKGLDKRPAGK